MKTRLLFLLLATLFWAAGCDRNKDDPGTRETRAEAALRSQVEAERTARADLQRTLEHEQRLRATERLAAEARTARDERKSSFGATLSVIFACLAAVTLLLFARERRLRMVLVRLLEWLLRRRANHG